MASKKRLNILLADDGSEHAQSAVELLRGVVLPPKSRVTVLRVFTPGQITSLPDFENSLEKTRNQLLNAGIKAEANLNLGSGSPAEKIIEIAETENHHPVMHVYYSKVVVELWTHAIGGLSENDFIMAAKIDKII